MKISIQHFLKLLLVIALPVAILGQDIAVSDGKHDVSEAVLFDEYGRVGECEFRSRVDVLLAELSKQPQVQGYIINYNGTNVLPAQYGVLSRERELMNHIRFRRFDPSRITFVNGGYRDEIITELWLVPPGAEAPKPSRTIAEPKIPVNRSFLYDRGYLSTEYGNLAEEFVLPSVREKEHAELDAMSDSEETETEEIIEPVADTEDVVEPDPRTPEEIENEKFEWVSGAFGKFLKENPAHSGSVVFYADDQRYDIAQMQTFISAGVARLQKSVTGRTVKIDIIFGGYHTQKEIEFWAISPGGDAPILTPETREPEEVEVEKPVS